MPTFSFKVFAEEVGCRAYLGTTTGRPNEAMMWQ